MFLSQLMTKSFFTSLRKDEQYHSISGSGDERRSSDTYGCATPIKPNEQYHHVSKSRRSLLCLVWLNMVFFVISSTMFLMSLQPRPIRYTDHIQEQLRNYHLKSVSMPCKLPSRSIVRRPCLTKTTLAPVLDDVDIGLSLHRMDATLLNREPPIIYRREPSKEVDKAWEALYDTRPIPLTREQVVAMGKDPASSVKIPSDWGHGNDSYFGRLDVFHQLHCLDALRREARWDHYYARAYPGGFNTTTQIHQLHLSHCAWLLAQKIICAASTDVYTHFWTDTVDHPFPDFGIEQKCKNYDSITSWQRENALNEEAFVKLKRPDGYPVHVMSHKFKEVHGWFEDHRDDGDDGAGEIA